MGRKAARPVPNGARKQELLVCAGILAAILFIFWQTGEYSVIGVDDTTFTSGNFVVAAGLTWSGVRYAFTSNEMGSWHPLTWLAHMLDYELFGDDLGRHHWVSVGWHVVNSWLVFLLLRLITGTLWRAAAVALLFAVHPMHVEPVVWLGDRKGLMVAFFWLSSTIAWVLSLQQAERKWRWRSAALALFGLGLMSKPVIVTLPFALVLLEYWPLGRWSNLGQAPRAVLDKVPFLLLAAVASVVTYYGQFTAGAMELYGSLPPGARAANAAYAIAMYLWKTLWPADLAFNYTLRPLTAAEVIGSAALALTLTAAAVWRARAHPYLAFGWFWFIGVLVPTLGIVQTGDQAFADRYAYLPHIGLFMALVWGIHAVVKPEWAHAGWFRAAGGGLLAVLIWVSLVQTSYWSHPIPFWEHTLAIVPHHVQGHQVLGKAYTDQRDLPRALIHLRKAIELRPQDPDGHRKLSELQFLLGQKQDALASLDTAERLNPASATTQYNRALVLRELGRPEEALAAMEKALERGLPPGAEVEALFQIGRIHHAMGQTGQEAASFERLLELDPLHYMARKNLAFAYLKLQQFAEAERELRRLATVNPGDEDVVRSFRYLRNRVAQ